ncbi:MAG: alpha/beta hydrolase [Gaiellaceae bacterium]
MSDGLSHVARSAVAAPAGALVLLHGRGADEHDLAPLLDLLDPERRLLGLVPRGPLTLPPGGAHWYVVREVGFPDPATFLPAYRQVGAWLDEALADAGVAPERAVLGGFSQGAVMSYALGLGAGRPRPAAILAMSGFVPRVNGFELDLEGRARLPVSISHGTYDPVIDVGFGREARERLESAGLAVTYREDPVAHQISPGALAQARAVLESALV